MTLAQFKQGMDQLAQSKNIHKVRGGYYTKNHLNMITWHSDGNQKLVVLNDASGDDWRKIKQER